jgi:cytochrome P450
VTLVVARHRGPPSPANYFVFNGFYSIVWPVALAVLLAMRNPWFLPAIFLPIALAQRSIRLRLRQTVPRAPSAARSMPRQETANFVVDKGNPYPHYARLRAIAPVLKLDWAGLGQTWIVTRHREALTVFKDAGFIRNASVLQAPGQAARAHRDPVRGFGHDLVDLDPPDHTRLRRLVSKAFTPRMVDRFEPRIEQLADQILDRSMARGEIELISEYASVIPLTTVSEMLGVPVGDPMDFRAFLYALTLSQLTGQSSGALDDQKSRFTNDLHAIFAARRAEPRDDLVTALVQAEQDGDSLSADELVGMVYLLLLAGFMTTVNLIGNGMLNLLRHPDQLDLWRQNPALADSAVEELLRFDSPLEFASVCYAATDVVLGSRPIPKGAAVRVLIPSVNRDPGQFADPDRLDITRRSCPHLSFGSGIHHCLGAPLARLEGRIALGKLVARAPNARLIDPGRITWLPHPVFRGVRRLPVRL